MSAPKEDAPFPGGVQAELCQPLGRDTGENHSSMRVRQVGLNK